MSDDMFQLGVSRAESMPPVWSHDWSAPSAQDYPTGPIPAPKPSTAYLANLIAALVASVGIVIGSAAPWVTGRRPRFRPDRHPRRLANLRANDARCIRTDRVPAGVPLVPRQRHRRRHRHSQDAGIQ